MSLTQASEPTTTTTVTELINASYISRLLETTATDPKIGELISMRTMLSPLQANSYVYDIVTANEFTGAAVVAQNDAAPEESFNPTKATLTGARRGLRGFVLDATVAAIMPVINQMVLGLDHAVRDLLHREVLGLFTSISASAGSNATENTFVNFDAQLAAFRAGLPDPGQQWCVMNPDAVRDLRADLMSSAAALYASTFGANAAAVLQSKNPGAIGLLGDTALYESNDTPAGDTTGWTNAIGVVNQGGLGMSGLEVVMWQDVDFEIQRDASRYGEWIVAGVIAAVGIRNQKNLRAFITRT